MLTKSTLTTTKRRTVWDRLRQKLKHVRESRETFEKVKTYENAVTLQAALRDFDALRKTAIQPISRRC